MVADDDPGARFSEHYTEVAPALFAWARLKVLGPLRDLADPEDLVQEVCFQAYRSFDRWDPARGAFRPWLFGVANHVVQMLLRKVARAHARLGVVQRLASQAGAVPAQATTISRRVARDEGLLLFVERVTGLPEDDRRLLVWRGLEGLRHADVAELLGVTEETAMKRWTRLRERLAGVPLVAGLLDGS